MALCSWLLRAVSDSSLANLYQGLGQGPLSTSRLMAGLRFCCVYCNMGSLEVEPGCCAFKLTHFKQVDQLTLAGKARPSASDAHHAAELGTGSFSSVTRCPCSAIGLLLQYSVASYDTPRERNTARNNGAQAEPGCVGGKLSILYVNNSYCKYKI